jgi:GNAT superfamily N-acetyltransferase
VNGIVIRRAVAADRSEIVEMTTAAFAHDPAWAWLMGEDYDRLAPEFVGALFDTRVASSTVWVDEHLATVAMWNPPRRSDEQARLAERTWSSYREFAGERAYARLGAYNDGTQAASPAQQHWYLGVLATRPSHQGKGLASALLEPVFALADRAREACCLETSTEANRQFYEHRGFVESGAVVLPVGAPPTWWMSRPPRDR